MSIATETARIKGNVAAALAAIAGKGVTVPDGSTSDALAELIEAIQSGGGDTSNIICGSFTLIETLPSSTQMYIDIQPPSQSFPLMYAVYEDAREYSFTDTSHTSERLLYLSSIRIKNDSVDNTKYLCFVAYNAYDSYTRKMISDSVNYRQNSYANAGGLYGSFEVSLDESKVRIINLFDGAPFLQGRTYYYILYWG